MSLSPINSDDAAFLAMAQRLAKRGLGHTSSNPSVGAVIVSGNDGVEIVARGWTQPGGRPHAETVALDRAGPRAEGATMYVTLEPCAHYGETPPCAGAIIDAGIARLVCAMSDPDPRVAGRGFARLREAGLEIVLAADQGGAGWIAQGHVLRTISGRPFVQLKLAVGADGRVPAANGAGAPVWITGERARARGHMLRAQADAIIIGRGTALADDPELTCRLPGLKGRSPLRVVLDSKLALSPQARLLATLDDADLLILCGENAEKEREEALRDKGARVVRITTGRDGRLVLKHAFETLAGEGVSRALVEGGPTLAKACLGAGLIDEAVFFTGCEAVGQRGMLPFVDDGLDCITRSGHFALCAERTIGGDTMAVYRREA